jgi:hypothetical protein
LNGGAVAVGIVMTAVSSGSNRRFAMSALRPIVLGVVVWGVVTNEVRADPITWSDWTAWFVGQNQGNGSDAFNLGNFPGPTAAPTQPQPQPSQGPPITNSPAPQPITIPSGPAIANGPLNSVAYAAPITSAPAEASSSPAASSVVSAAVPVDAYINVGAGPYPAQSSITTGNAQPWYNSPQITSLFGGNPPTAQQQQSFDNTVLQRVQQSFSQSGVSVTLTDNPNVAALHTISLVSNTTSTSLPSAIGMTQVGGNGFSFIDVSAPSAQTLDQLEWIVAHNISHELMLAFGVPEKYDTTGNYLDAKMASLSMMLNPNATFSSAAAQAITQALASQNVTGSLSQLGAQGLDGSPAPEPTTLAIWALAAAALLVAQRTRSRRAAA